MKKQVTSHHPANILANIPNIVLYNIEKKQYVSNSAIYHTFQDNMHTKESLTPNINNAYTFLEFSRFKYFLFDTFFKNSQKLCLESVERFFKEWTIYTVEQKNGQLIKETLPFKYQMDILREISLKNLSTLASKINLTHRKLIEVAKVIEDLSQMGIVEISNVINTQNGPNRNQRLLSQMQFEHPVLFADTFVFFANKRDFAYFGLATTETYFCASFLVDVVNFNLRLKSKFIDIIRQNVLNQSIHT